MNQEGLMFPKTRTTKKKRMKHPKSILHEKNGTFQDGICRKIETENRKSGSV